MVRVRESVSHGSPLGKQAVLLPYQDMTPRYNINFEWYRINKIISFTAEPKNAPVIPYSEIFHSQRSRRPLIIMREALGVEQFNNGRDRSDGHHDQMGQTIPVNANEKLRKKNRSTERFL